MSSEEKNTDNLLKEIRSLRADVCSKFEALQNDIGRLEQSIGQGSPTHTEEASTQVSLRIFFGEIIGDRKPFYIQTDGLITARVNLSPVRTAIFLVLLIDLQDRTEGGSGIIDPFQAIKEAYQLLEIGGSTQRDPAAALRVALYRFDLFLAGEKLFVGEDYALRFDSQALRLEICENSTKKSTTSLGVQVSSVSPRIAEIIDDFLLSSPLVRVRKTKGLYFSGGPMGQFRLIHELFNTKFTITETSLFFRPIIHSYPRSVLQAMKKPPEHLARYDVAIEAYETRRCRFTEILNRQTIWDLITLSSDQSFKLYPSSVTKEHVISHLDFLIKKIASYENYSLIITDALFPFYVVTFELKSRPIPEYFTLFARNFDQDFLKDVSCFVVYDAGVYQSIMENVVGWVHRHPTTETNRDEVISSLEEVREHLRENGPLPAKDSPVQ